MGFCPRGLHEHSRLANSLHLFCRIRCRSHGLFYTPLASLAAIVDVMESMPTEWRTPPLLSAVQDPPASRVALPTVNLSVDTQGQGSTVALKQLGWQERTKPPQHPLFHTLPCLLPIQLKRSPTSNNTPSKVIHPRHQIWTPVSAQRIHFLANPHTSWCVLWETWRGWRH